MTDTPGGEKKPLLVPRQWIGLGAGVAAFLAIAFLPSGLHEVEGQGSRPAYAAATAALMAIWWFTEALPIHWTACVPLLAYPLLGVFRDGTTGAEFVPSVKGALHPYGDAFIFLFMGGMAIGAAMEQCNLHRRVALTIMKFVGTSPKRLLLGMLIAPASISLWISNTATAVMMLPIGMAILAQLEKARGGGRLNHYGSAIMLAIAYACNVGGVGTIIATAPNAFFSSYVGSNFLADGTPISAAVASGIDVADLPKMEITFLFYMGMGVPFVVLFIPVVWLVLWRLGRRDDLGEGQGRAVIDRELREMGPMSRNEKIVGAIFLSVAGLWVMSRFIRGQLFPDGMLLDFKVKGKHFDASVAVLAAVVLLSTGLLSMQRFRRMPWSTLVLLGGSFSMAAGISGSGLSAWMTERLSALAELPLYAQISLAATATVILSAVASNTASAVVLLPILPQSMPVLAGATIASSCDFMLPAGTPPNAIVFGSGYIRLPTMMKTGFVLDVAAAILVSLYGVLYVQHLF